MHIDWSTLLLQTVNVLVLVWLLARFLFKPVAAMLATRQEAAGKLLAEAGAAQKSALEARDAAERERATFDAGRADALREADAAAAAEKARLVEAAQAEIAQMKQAAAAELERSRAAQLDRMHADAAALAVAMAAKLVERLPREAKIAGFIDGLANALGTLPAASRDELTAGAAPLTLCAPCEPSGAEQATIAAALASALGRRLTLDFAVDPALIAGLELRGPHVVVANHLRRDLDEICVSLTDIHEDALRVRR